MAGKRYEYYPKGMWGWLGKALQGIDQDLIDIETNGVKATGNIDAAQVTSGVIASDRLGLGVADGTTFLAGDGTWKKPSGTTGTVSSVAWGSVTDKPTFASVATSGAYADLSGKPTIPDVSGLAPKASPTFTGTATFSGAVVGLTKSTVGLGNVDNTADTAKAFTAAQITSGVLAPARLGTGTASASTVLYGDGTWKDAPTGGSGSSGGVGTDITIRQGSTGTWPTITRTDGAVYRWHPTVTPVTLPTRSAGAMPGDELVGVGPLPESLT